MRLEGGRVYLKPFTREYAEHWVRWTQDEDVIRYSVMRSYTMEEELEHLEEREKNKNAYDQNFSIFIKENDKIIGNCGVHPSKIKEFPDVITVGLVIGEKDEWGKGYGTDAMKTLLKYVKNKLNLREVYLSVDIPNLPAQKVYKKCGFEEVGVYDNPERTNSNGKSIIMKIKL